MRMSNLSTSSSAPTDSAIVSHIYQVGNRRGPSDIVDADVFILWPSRIETGDALLDEPLINTTATCRILDKNDEEDTRLESLLSLKLSALGLLRTWNNNTNYSSLSLADDIAPHWSVIHCKVDRIGANSNVLFNITSRMDEENVNNYANKVTHSLCFVEKSINCNIKLCVQSISDGMGR